MLINIVTFYSSLPPPANLPLRENCSEVAQRPSQILCFTQKYVTLWKENAVFNRHISIARNSTDTVALSII